MQMNKKGFFSFFFLPRSTSRLPPTSRYFLRLLISFSVNFSLGPARTKTRLEDRRSMVNALSSRLLEIFQLPFSLRWTQKLLAHTHTQIILSFTAAHLQGLVVLVHLVQLALGRVEGDGVGAGDLMVRVVAAGALVGRHLCQVSDYRLSGMQVLAESR